MPETLTSSAKASGTWGPSGVPQLYVRQNADHAELWLNFGSFDFTLDPPQNFSHYNPSVFTLEVFPLDEDYQFFRSYQIATFEHSVSRYVLLEEIWQIADFTLETQLCADTPLQLKLSSHTLSICSPDSAAVLQERATTVSLGHSL